MESGEQRPRSARGGGGEAGQSPRARRLKPSPAATGAGDVGDQLASSLAALAAWQEALRKGLYPSEVAEVARQLTTFGDRLKRMPLSQLAEAARQGSELAKAWSLVPRSTVLTVPTAEPGKSVQPEPQLPKGSGLPHFESYEQNRHVKAGWQRSDTARAVKSAIQAKGPLDVIVLAADIRSSTVLMKEAVDLYRFASTLGELVEESRDLIWAKGGIFDKFTGDGFLAYWIDLRKDDAELLGRIFAVVAELQRSFAERYMRFFVANSQNFPTNRIGLGIGLDQGRAYPVAVADDPTIVGPAVVGAVRMVSGARPGETLLNSSLGAKVERLATEGGLSDISVEQVPIASKEYQEQLVYALVIGRERPKGAASGG